MTDKSARAQMLNELDEVGDVAVRFAELFSTLIADPSSVQRFPLQSRETPSMTWHGQSFR